MLINLNIRKFFWYGLTVSMFTAVKPAVSQEVAGDSPLWTIHAAANALRFFSNVKANVKCFWVSQEYKNNQLTVIFFDPNDTIVSSQGVIVHASKCGFGGVFIYRKPGILVNHYYIK